MGKFECVHSLFRRTQRNERQENARNLPAASELMKNAAGHE